MPKHGIRTGDLIKDKTIHDLEIAIDKVETVNSDNDIFQAIESTLENLSYFALSLEVLQKRLLEDLKKQ